jgi:biopolymer transport protein ExbD
MRFITPQWRPSAAKRRARLRSAIDVSGFASIMFALLFLQFGLLLPAHSPMRSLPADLPRTFHATLQPAALREEAMTLIITRDDMLYFRNTKIPSKTLPDAIRTAVRDGYEKTLYIKVDARAKYRDVKIALDSIRSANTTNIVFLTEHAEATSTP